MRGPPATAWLEMWKRKTAYLAWWWDVMDFEELVRVHGAAASSAIQLPTGLVPPGSWGRPSPPPPL